VTALDTRARELAQAPNFATLSVILRSGRPMTHVMWVDADEDHILSTPRRTARSSGRSSETRA